MAYRQDVFIWNVHGPVMIMEFIVTVIVFSIGIIILRRWKERRTKPTLYLALAMFSVGSATLFAFLGLFIWFLNWIAAGFPADLLNTPLSEITTPIAYSCVIPYVIFLFLFTIHIFSNKNDKRAIPLIIIGAIIVTLIFHPQNYWGLALEITDPPKIQSIVLGIYLIFNLIIYIVLFSYAYKESRRTEDEIMKKGFFVIALGQIANMFVFIFFLTDSIYSTLNPTFTGYSIFIYLAWISAMIAAILFYVGYILPNWFRKIISKE
ncbi:MAG: hypothetical protein ACFFD2_10135 [Promethearchaeota archaeon]